MSSLYNHLSSNHNNGSSGITTSSSANSTQGGSSGGFPLRNNFFRSLPLSKETIDSLYHSAKANATACLNQSFNDQWRYVPPEKDGTQLRKDTSDLSSSFRLVRAATVLRCQEHEVNMVISNTNTDSWREFMRKCFGKQYLDTMILHSLMNPVDKSPPVGMELPTPASTASPPPSTSTSSIDNNRSHRDPSEQESGSDDEHGPRQTIYLAGKSMDGEQEGTTEREREDESIPDDSSEQRLSDMTQREDTGALFNGEDFDELMTVKWGAMDAGSSGKHDLCLVDYLSTGFLPSTDNQEKVHLWCFSSVEGERVGCMALKDTHNISRTTLTKLGVFWRKLNEDETEVIVCGSFPSKHAKYVSSILLQSLNRLQGIVEDLRLSNQIYVHRSTWVKDHERSSCHLCMRNFHALRRKHHCRKCGEVICSDCSLVENVDLPVIGSSKLRLCKVCCVKAKSTPLKKQDKSNVFDHVVRARSLSNISVHSPYGSRMSFMDTGGSTGSLVGKSSSSLMGGTNNKSKSEQLIEASCHSSSSMSSDNNSNEVYEVMEEYDSKPTFTTFAQAGDFDDFIDTRCLNRQLSALEMNQSVKNDGHGSNSNMFDLLCELACQTLNCPIASVSVIDSQGDSIRSSAGLNDNPSMGEELAVFIDKIMGSTAAIVLDSNVDKQVQALFTRRIPSIRFFAGCPVFSRSGKKLGFVCVADVTKRDTLGSSCAFTMERLATLAITTMERSMSSKQQTESGSYSSNNQTSHQYQQQSYPTNTRSHPATIFDRPNVPRSRRKDGHFSDSGGGYPQPMQARVYDVSDPELVGGSSIPSPVAPPPRGYSGEYSTGYYEAQERMRKLLLKSYHTQQQLASGGGAMPLPPE